MQLGGGWLVVDGLVAVGGWWLGGWWVLVVGWLVVDGWFLVVFGVVRSEL